MRRTGFVYSPVYLKHDTGSHPENPARLTAIINRIEKEKLKDVLIHINPLKAAEEQISLVHDKEYIYGVEQACKKIPPTPLFIKGGEGGLRNLDADTVISEASYEAALFAAGGVISGIDAIFEGKTDNVFCAVRPPGHHAERDRAMGFCLFNNIAIGAKYAQERYGVKRVFIADWDLHHGNGTQNAFYNDPTVFYISTHRQYIFPGTGRANEIGEGDGKGFNMNIPLSVGQGDIEYVSIFEERIYPAIMKYKPDLIMLSAGFDAHSDDPLGDMNLTAEGFGRLTDIICKAADEVCKGRIVSVLEGGYNLEALGESVVFHLKSLMGRTKT
ncbi:MAG: histone deacetylase [Nitrospinae bacterium]|nr:histone deacetylase [Nitrospinota bacterium]